MKRFVMGDIHGGYPALLQCLKRSGFNYDTDLLIQLGDIVDGHDCAYCCVEELLKIKNLICIKGNHDVWFLEFIKTGQHPKLWGHGGEATKLSYKRQKIKQTGLQYAKNSSIDLLPEDLPQSHRNFFLNQKLYHITDDNCLFVHAGFKPYLSLQQQGDHLYNDRSFWEEIYKYRDGVIPEKFKVLQPYLQIYIGHTPTTKYGTDQPIHILNITNMDTGAAKGNNGRITIMNLDTKDYWQSDEIDFLCST